ncbi:MAG: hypothetical protein NT032_07830 [Actinobacteria bacterium]|nr:hypothetical protein [Actinomycetota bacterium]
MNNESDNLAESSARTDLEIAIPGVTNFANEIAAMTEMATKFAIFQKQFQLSQPLWSQSLNQLAERVSSNLSTIKAQLANVTILDPKTIALLRESSLRWQELLHLRHAQRSTNWEAWTDPSEWFHDYYTASETGWLFIEFPSSDLTRIVVNAPEDERADILLTHSKELTATMAALLGEPIQKGFSIYKTALGELLECARSENWIAVQTLSILFISSLGENELLNGTHIRRVSLAAIPGYESMSNDLELTGVVNSLLHFWPEESGDLTRISRNASMHHLDERQQTPQHAIQSLVNAVSLYMFMMREAG